MFVISCGSHFCAKEKNGGSTENRQIYLRAPAAVFSANICVAVERACAACYSLNVLRPPLLLCDADRSLSSSSWELTAVFREKMALITSPVYVVPQQVTVAQPAMINVQQPALCVTTTPVYNVCIPVAPPPPKVTVLTPPPAIVTTVPSPVMLSPPPVYYLA